MKQLLGSVLAMTLVFTMWGCNDGPSTLLDGGTGGGTGGGAGMADAGPSLKQATISLLRTPFDGGGIHGDNQASSLRVDATEYSPQLFTYLNSRCPTVASSGNCVVTNCDTRNPDAGTSETRKVGTVTVTGSSVTGPVVATGDATAFFSDGLWSTPGQVLTVSSAGSDVPAFSGKTVKAPDDVILTSPACVTDSSLGNTVCSPLSHTSAVSLAWSSGANGAFSLVLGNLLNGGQGPLITCNFPEGSHSGTIDASLMSHMNVGSTLILWSTSSANTFRVNDWDVTLQAYYSQFLGGSITIQ